MQAIQKNAFWAFIMIHVDLIYQGSGLIEPENWMGFPSDMNSALV